LKPPCLVRAENVRAEQRRKSPAESSGFRGYTISIEFFD